MRGSCPPAWRSAAFRFVDAAGDHHVITADLVDLGSQGSEAIGEVVLGPADLLGALEEDDAGVERDEVDPVALAGRTVAALAATDEPPPSAVANGRLLAARLSTLVVGEIRCPSLQVRWCPTHPSATPTTTA